MNCFFDPAHGPGVQNLMWAPQWGVARGVMSCVACAQRWAGLQQSAAQGYAPAPQQGYAPQPGYAPQGYAAPAQQQAQPQRQGPGWGGVVAAGAAGLVGGALINEMLDDDEPQQIVNITENYDEYGAGSGDGDWF
ncbi:hypothetical protein AB0K09_10730 [Streptomyces sp. NPDC049577]|uniref:hypothetical protein n=1 Tax=Streptomyces sp. NPDC049577 TaxID=3155153 RepID=UPI0034429136